MKIKIEELCVKRKGNVKNRKNGRWKCKKEQKEQKEYNDVKKMVRKI